MGLEKEGCLGEMMDHSNLEKKIVDMSRKTGREGTGRSSGNPQNIDEQGSIRKDTSGRLSLPELKAAVDEISGLAALINERLNEFVVGNHDVIDLVLLALFNEGHILVEGVPGTAKTTIAKSIAILTGCSFNRIQGAIDL